MDVSKRFKKIPFFQRYREKKIEKQFCEYNYGKKVNWSFFACYVIASSAWTFVITNYWSAQEIKWFWIATQASHILWYVCMVVVSCIPWFVQRMWILELMVIISQVLCSVRHDFFVTQYRQPTTFLDIMLFVDPISILILRMRFYVNVVYFSVIIGSHLCTSVAIFVFIQNTPLNIICNSLVYLVIYALSMVWIYHYEINARRTFETTQKLEGINNVVRTENEKTARLLRAIIPRKFVSEIRDRGVEDKCMVFEMRNSFVLQADVCDFTRFCGEHSLNDVMLLLNTLYSNFDEVGSVLSIEKVKTIGDGYLTVGSRVLNAKFKNKNIVLAAFAFQMVIDKINKDVAEWNVRARIGIAFGFLLGGILGDISHRITFDVFGDPVLKVNILEQEGAEGHIHCDSTTFEFAKKFLSPDAALDETNSFLIDSKKVQIEDARKIAESVYKRFGMFQSNEKKQLNSFHRGGGGEEEDSDTGSDFSQLSQHEYIAMKEGRLQKLLKWTKKNLLYDSENEFYPMLFRYKDRKKERKFSNFMFSNKIVFELLNCCAIIVFHVMNVSYFVIYRKINHLYDNPFIISVYISFLLCILAGVFFSLHRTNITYLQIVSLVNIVGVMATGLTVSFVPFQQLIFDYLLLIDCVVVCVIWSSNFLLSILKIIALFFYVSTIMAFKYAYLFREFHFFEFLLRLRLSCLLVLFGIIGIYVSDRNSRNIFNSLRKVKLQNERVNDEKTKNTNLILSVLPKTILRSIMDSDSYHYSRKIEMACVCFFKIENMLVKEAASIKLFSQVLFQLDQLCVENKCVKIKSFFENYLYFAEREEHGNDDDNSYIRNAVNNAIGFREYFVDFVKREQLDWHCKIGLNCGPIYSGIVGQEKFIYDIFGQTANCAARVQALCSPNQIRVSNSMHAIMKEDRNNMLQSERMKSLFFHEEDEREMKGIGSFSSFVLLTQ